MTRKDEVELVSRGHVVEGVDHSDRREQVEVVDPADALLLQQGPPGEKGDKGEKGDQGDKGEKGDQGDPGTPGDQGTKGDKGDAGGSGPIGPGGGKGDDGPQGPNGWTPVLAVETDGERRVLRVVGWIGGEPDKQPDTVGWYVGEAGFVKSIKEAVNIRGPAGEMGPRGFSGSGGGGGQISGGGSSTPGTDGDDGWSPIFAVVVDGVRYVLQVTDWTGGQGTKPATGVYVGATGFVSDIANAIDIRGAAGADGAAGPQGEPGTPGANGTNGADGSPGPAGPAGDDGEAGADGIPGSQGPEGPQGTQGIQGVQGVPGDDGAPGAPGAVGPQGSQGVVGPQGSDGEDGAQGPKGDKGDQGIQGVQGIQGIQGVPGNDGATGAPGATGAQGERGYVGPPGQDGEEGPIGLPGLKGDKGDKGDQGPPGVEGEEGNVGPIGPTGMDGSDGGFKYTFTTSTSGDPGSGKFGFDNATFTSATKVNISETDGNGNGLATLLQALDNSGSALLLCMKQGGAAHFSAWITTGTMTDSGAWDSFSIAPISTTGTIANGDIFHVHVVPLLAGDANLYWDRALAFLGIGTATPRKKLEVSGNNTASIYLSDPTNMSHGMTGVQPADVFGALFQDSGTTGGLSIRGFSDTDAPTLRMDGFIGSTAPAFAAVQVRGFKWDGGTSIAALGSTEKVFQVTNFSTHLITVLGGGNVGIGTIAPHASAIVDETSTTKGRLVPRMTTTQRDAISSPATSLLIFNTTLNSFNYYDGTNWLAGVGFRANKNATNQTGVADSTDTKVTFTTEAFDAGSFYDATNSKWTPPAGLVMLSAALAVSGTIAVSAELSVKLYKNGAELARTTAIEPAANSNLACPFSIVDQANGTDYYEIYVNIRTVAASTATVLGAVVSSFFSGCVVR